LLCLDFSKNDNNSYFLVKGSKLLPVSIKIVIPSLKTPIMLCVQNSRAGSTRTVDHRYEFRAAGTGAIWL
jgi:hypothetical protein